jgi:hypothetical protein
MPLTASQQAFVDRVTPYAMAASQATGIDPRVIIAQAALESAWGTAAPGGNYFGIKGPGQVQATKEFENGRMVPQNASFRTYSGPEQSFQDYARLMNTGFYSPVRQASGLEGQTAALGKSGYATDPNYGSKLAAIAGDISVQPPPSFTPPLPNLRGDVQTAFASPGIYGNGGINGTWAGGSGGFSPASPASFNPLQFPDYQPQPQQQPQAAPQQVAQNAPGFVDDLGGGMSPLQSYKVGEPDALPAGPYGADSLALAMVVGDPEAIKTMGAQLYRDVIAKYGEPGLLNMGALLGAQREIADYFTKTLPTQAPGAVRQVQTALATNPALSAMIPKDQQAYFQKAFAALPQQTTGQTAMPNLRPSTIPDMPPPLVASAPSTAPKMASYEPPQDTPSKPDIPPLSWSYRPPGPSAPQTPSWTAPTETLARTFNYPSSPSTGFGNAAAAPYTAPRVQPATGSTALGNALLGFGSPLPSSAFTGAPPASAAGLAAGRGSMGYLANGLPKNPQFSSAVAMGNALMQPKPNMRPPMPQQPQVTLASALSPPPQAMPQAMPTFGPTGPAFDVSNLSVQDKANAFAAANPGNPSFVRPTDAQGNFQPNDEWRNETQYLPDLGWSDNRYYVPQ